MPKNNVSVMQKNGDDASVEGEDENTSTVNAVRVFKYPADHFSAARHLVGAADHRKGTGEGECDGQEERWP